MAEIASISQPDWYYQGAREDFIQELPVDPAARILELGCANGGTGALALRDGRCGEYSAIEVNEAAAAEAAKKLTQVLVFDIERESDLPWPEEYFDALIISEVLEHLVDPWEVVRRLSSYLKKGGMLLCSSPNVGHYHFIKRIWNQRWDLEDAGIMDRTHLRWFTPKSYAQLVEQSGFVVDDVSPVKPFDWWDHLRIWITGGRSHLFMKQVKIRATRV